MKKLFVKTDFLIIISVLILSLLLFIPNLSGKDRLTAQILVDGEIVEESNLAEVTEPRTLKIRDGVEILSENGKICFSQARGEDELCVKSGWLSKKGQTAACLPERVVITIKGTDKTDMMTY